MRVFNKEKSLQPLSAFVGVFHLVAAGNQISNLDIVNDIDKIAEAEEVLYMSQFTKSLLTDLSKIGMMQSEQKSPHPRNLSQAQS
jgi:hypothetical protein